jgi:D-sedoheptulose 7-phosphate isomerase
MDTRTFHKAIEDSIAVKRALLGDSDLLDRIRSAVLLCIDTLRDKKGKILFCGNGGSAADAQHLAAELSGRFYYDRPPLFAEALHVNTSYLTAVANDYSYDEIYSRLVEGKGRAGDLLVALSTSGQSPNIVNAARKAQSMGIRVIGMTGAGGGALKPYCDLLLDMPSTDTPRIQEGHILVGHIICEQVEANLFPKKA